MSATSSVPRRGQLLMLGVVACLLTVTVLNGCSGSCVQSTLSGTDVLSASLLSGSLPSDCHAACDELAMAQGLSYENYSASLCSFVPNINAVSGDYIDPSTAPDGGPAVVCSVHQTAFRLPAGFTADDGGSTCQTLCAAIGADSGSGYVGPSPGVAPVDDGWLGYEQHSCFFTSFSTLQNWDAGSISDGGPGVSCSGSTAVCDDFYK